MDGRDLEEKRLKPGGETERGGVEVKKLSI